MEKFKEKVELLKSEIIQLRKQHELSQEQLDELKIIEGRLFLSIDIELSSEEQNKIISYYKEKLIFVSRAVKQR